MAKRRKKTALRPPEQASAARVFHRPLAALGKRPPAPAAAPGLAAAVKAAHLASPAAGSPAGDPAAAARPEPDSDQSLFLRAVAGAQPLGRGRERLPAPPAPVTVPPADEAQVVAELQALVRGDGSFRMNDEMAGEEGYAGAASGVSRQLLLRLQRGHFAYGMHLDLHGLFRDAAHAAAARFVTQARRQGERCVLIITGRGRSSPNGEAVLRQALPRWLSRAPIQPHVLAFCTARAVDGGPGAFYVLLRRSGIAPFEPVVGGD